MYKWLFFSLLLLGNSGFGQIEITKEEDSPAEETFERKHSHTGHDWIMDTVELPNAQLIHLTFRTDMEKKYYFWLRKRVRDVWPYVKTAVEEYNALTDTAQYLSKRERRIFIKNRKKELADEFEKKLKEMSLSRGQILVKLIYRETDKTAYDIIRELRGGFNAFFWNSAGGAYNLDLKSEFDPYKTREDLYIEVILQKDFRSGRLEKIKLTD